MSATAGNCDWCRVWSRIRFYVRLLDASVGWVCSDCERGIARHRAWRTNDEMRKLAYHG